jgi:hypothetical protein
MNYTGNLYGKIGRTRVPLKLSSADVDKIERVRVTITEGAWKGEKGWITGPKNEVDANPITTDRGICLCWFDSEIRRENVHSNPPP